MTNKNKYILRFLTGMTIIILALASCGGGEALGVYGTVTLSFGGGRAAYPPDDEMLVKLSYTVELTGTARITAGPTAPGQQNIKMTAPPGQYAVTVTAWLDGKVYAEGFSTAVVQAGRTTSVPVTMNAAIRWHTVNASPFGNAAVHTITYGDGKFVAVGNNGTIAWSADGITWTKVNSDFGANDSVFGIAYGLGPSGTSYFVAVGNVTKMAYSTNGTTWTAVPYLSSGPFGTATQINAVAYGNSDGSDYYVAVTNTLTNNGGIAYAADPTAATSWQAVTTTNNPFATGIPINSIAYGGGKFVAVGHSGKIAYPTSSISEWQFATTNGTFSDNEQVTAVAYGDGKFVAGGTDGKMAYSSDGGANWTAVPGAFDTLVKTITYGDGRFIAAGADGKMALSFDGVKWTAMPSITAALGASDISAVAYGNGRFVAGSADGKLAYSD